MYYGIVQVESHSESKTKRHQANLRFSHVLSRFFLSARDHEVHHGLLLSVMLGSS